MKKIALYFVVSNIVEVGVLFYITIFNRGHFLGDMILFYNISIYVLNLIFVFIVGAGVVCSVLSEDAYKSLSQENFFPKESLWRKVYFFTCNVLIIGLFFYLGKTVGGGVCIFLYAINKCFYIFFKTLYEKNVETRRSEAKDEED